MTMAAESEPATRVTLRDVYNVALETQNKVSPLPAQVSDHEVRLRAIERYLWIWIGAAGVIGAGGGQILNAIINN